MRTKPMTLESLTGLLRSRGVEQARLEALVLIEFVGRLPRAKVVAGDFQLSAAAAKRLRKLALRRRQPLAYLTKRKEFRGLSFYVDQRVLIPRPESEDLVEAALALKPTPELVYDVGCGSGCLAISYLAAASKHPLRTVLIDNSRGALRVARKNCRRHRVAGVTFEQRNLLNLPECYFMPGSLILANLPYLDVRRRLDYERTCPTLLEEPPGALYCAQRGLGLYRNLLANCRGQDLTIVCEHLDEQRAEMEEMATEAGFHLTSRHGMASVLQPSERNRANA